MKDLKTIISNKDNFIEIQKAMLDHDILWDSSGKQFKKYHKRYKFMYYRRKSNTIQFGTHDYNYKEDLATELSVDEFMCKLTRRTQ